MPNTLVFRKRKPTRLRKGAVGEELQLGARRNQWLEEARVHRVIEHREVPPLSREENAIARHRRLLISGYAAKR
jgi:hypothetical protein